MLSDVKGLLTNKIAMLVMVLTFLWLLIDSSARLFVSSSNNIVNDKDRNISALILPQLSEQDVSELTNAYKTYGSDMPTSQSGLSLAEQAKQQGELKSLFIGDNKLKLKAVITASENEKTVERTLPTQSSKLNALIEITNVKSGKKRIERFTDGVLVQGYMLAIEKSTQIILTKEQGQNQQKIILTMYSGNRSVDKQ